MSEERTTRRPKRKGGGFGPGRPAEKAKDFKCTVKKLIRYAGRFKVSLLFVIIFSVCSTIFNVVGPKILSTATTELFNGAVAVMNGAGGINFPKIGTILIWAAVALTVISLIDYVWKNRQVLTQGGM